MGLQGIHGLARSNKPKAATQIIEANMTPAAFATTATPVTEPCSTFAKQGRVMWHSPLGAQVPIGERAAL